MGRSHPRGLGAHCLAPRDGWAFVISGFPSTHRNSGVRALYRLCHHLNVRGFPTVVLADEGEPLPDWNCFVTGALGDLGSSVVIYPEVVAGNPLGADRVVRWVLNTPGLLGGDHRYDDSEVVFVYDLQKLPDVNRAVATPVGPERRLWTGLVDPSVIYPDPGVTRDLVCSFTHKGAHLARGISLPTDEPVPPLESLTDSLASLGDTLRRTRTLYSYDHYSNVLREAVISGCDVRVPDAAGRWHDPRTCECDLNIHWHRGIEVDYVEQFHSSEFVTGFIDQLPQHWELARPDPTWRAGLPHPSHEVSHIAREESVLRSPARRIRQWFGQRTGRPR